jgi:hypothetical protein
MVRELEHVATEPLRGESSGRPTALAVAPQINDNGMKPCQVEMREQPFPRMTRAGSSPAVQEEYVSWTSPEAAVGDGVIVARVETGHANTSCRPLHNSVCSGLMSSEHRSNSLKNVQLPEPSGIDLDFWTSACPSIDG